VPLAVDHRPRARADLLEIWLLIAADNESAADRTLGRFATVLNMLCEQPKAGRARPELGIPGLRSYPIGSYVLYYLPSPKTLTLVRVLEGHRDVQVVFERDEQENS
jgi:toxin ParE1/3/4